MCYTYTIEGNTVVATGGNQEAAVFDCSSWQPALVKRYQDMIAHREDLRYAKTYIDQMFYGDSTSLIDGALLKSAIELLVKCFSSPSSGGRSQLNAKKVFRTFAQEKGGEDFSERYFQFERARNKVLVHDEFDHAQCIVGLVIENSSGVAVDVAEIGIKTGYLYRENSELLGRMIDMALLFVDEQIASLKARLIDEYNCAPSKPALAGIVCENIPISNRW